MAQHSATLTLHQDSDDLARSVPLYVSSLLVTLAGIGAVGVTMNDPGWTPVWVFLTLLGHAISFYLRRAGFTLDRIFAPVMLVGTVVALQLAYVGSPLVGLQSGIQSLPPDMTTAVIIATIGVVRCFTLVTNAALLFSSVPAISMLALIGSTNPNAEIPLFFALVLLGSLFACSYEAQLFRAERSGRGAAPPLFHLLFAWTVVLAVSVGALSFSLLLRPVIGQFSPFALPTLSKVRSLLNFTQTNSQAAPVGRGPITLSPTPVFEVYGAEGGLFRTNVFSLYTGRGWGVEPQPASAEMPYERRNRIAGPGPYSSISLLTYEFKLPDDPDITAPVKTRTVTQQLVVKSAWTSEVPSLGRISRLKYPRQQIRLQTSGTVAGTHSLRPGDFFEVTARIPEYSAADLRKAPKPHASGFGETLSLPQSTFEVQELTREITQGATNSYDQVQAILAHIEKTCPYTLDEEPTPQGEDAVAYYLFKSRRGACDLAASAAAVMCRSVGIPARVAVGYVAEEPLEVGGGYLIRQEHAHMWVEAYFPGYGWVPFNPAPPLSKIRENPIMSALYALRNALARIGGGGLDALLLVSMILLTAGMLLYYSRRRLLAWTLSILGRSPKANPRVATAAVYQRALRLLSRRGWRREAWMTPRELAAALSVEWADTPQAVRALDALTDCLERALYREDETVLNLNAATAALRSLQRVAPRRPGSGVREWLPVRVNRRLVPAPEASA
jgi:hypothetical protein